MSVQYDHFNEALFSLSLAAAFFFIICILFSALIIEELVFDEDEDEEDEELLLLLLPADWEEPVLPPCDLLDKPELLFASPAGFWLDFECSVLEPADLELPLRLAARLANP